eukprot:6193482-Pleurochrysis_carterae.AAC.1
MARIHELAAEDLLPSRRWQLQRATRNHTAEFLPGGICAAESIAAETRKRLSGMPMTSTGAERLFAFLHAHDVRAGASPDNTRA